MNIIEGPEDAKGKTAVRDIFEIPEDVRCRTPEQITGKPGGASVTREDYAKKPEDRRNPSLKNLL